MKIAIILEPGDPPGPKSDTEYGGMGCNLATENQIEVVIVRSGGIIGYGDQKIEGEILSYCYPLASDGKPHLPDFLK